MRWATLVWLSALLAIHPTSRTTSPVCTMTVAVALTASAVTEAGLRLRVSKTDQAEAGVTVFLAPATQTLVDAWLEAGRITDGWLFRPVPYGTIWALARSCPVATHPAGLDPRGPLSPGWTCAGSPGTRSGRDPPKNSPAWALGWSRFGTLAVGPSRTGVTYTRDFARQHGAMARVLGHEQVPRRQLRHLTPQRGEKRLGSGTTPSGGDWTASARSRSRRWVYRSSFLPEPVTRATALRHRAPRAQPGPLP